MATTKADRGSDDKRPDDEAKSEKSPNAAPDAVKDPNAKTEGKPGAAPQGDEVDPGAG